MLLQFVLLVALFELFARLIGASWLLICLL